MRSNLSVGMPIDLLCYERDALKVGLRRRFEPADAYFSALSTEWSLGVREVFRRLPNLPLKTCLAQFSKPIEIVIGAATTIL